MTDYESRRKVPRYDPGVPATGVAAILVTVIAAAAGFVVLRNINNDTESVTSLGVGSAAVVGDNAGPVVVAPGGDTGTSTDPAGSVVTPTTPTVAAPATDFTGTSVIVANANSVGGSAGDATTLLESATDFVLAKPDNASDAVGQLEKSVIYYDSANPAAQPVAVTLARVLGGLTINPLPTESPIKGERGDAGVVLMLGNDLAEMKLIDLVEPLKAGAATTPTVPAADPAADPATDSTDPST